MPFPIIAAIGLALSAYQAKQQADAQQSAQVSGAANSAAEKNKNPMQIDPTIKYDPKAGREAADAANPNPYATAFSQGAEPQDLLLAMRGMSQPQAGPVAQPMQSEIEKANNQGPPVVTPGSKNYSALPQEPGVMTGQSPSQLDAKLNNDMSAAQEAGKTMQVEPTKEGMSWDDKMQYAAMAASVGSALANNNRGPAPPGLGRGGGINMQPVFMSARRAYGG